MVGRIIGTGSCVPQSVITNDDLSQIVDTNDEWISSRTGIKERRIAREETLASLGSEAAKNALENANMKPEDIDLIIVATMSGDHSLPNAAGEIQKEIKAVNAVCFDLNAACTGFVFALNTAQAYIKAELAKNVLVIGADVVSKQIDWNDRSTCVLFGDGAGAAVVTADTTGIMGIAAYSDGAKGDVLTCKLRPINNSLRKDPVDVDYIKMEGQEVFKFAVKKVPESILAVLEQAKVGIEEVDLFVLHQANSRILQSVSKRLQVPMGKIPMNLDRFGNTSAASVPILLDELNRKGAIKPKDKIILSGFGGGLTWGSTLIEW